MTAGGRQTRAEGAAVEVVVMAKYPATGSVKSRLAGAIGAEAAAEVYRAFVLDLAQRLEGTGIDALWAVWPPSAPFGDLLPGVRLLPQEGADLGARMAGVARRLLSQGARGVIFLGADVPHVDLDVVHGVIRLLEGGADEVALGPADDGGYYLLGLGRFIPELFGGIDWGGPRVCAATEARLGRLGVRYRLLAPTFDVDEADDLVRLAESMARGAVSLPHTAAALARAGLR